MIAEEAENAGLIFECFGFPMSFAFSQDGTYFLRCLAFTFYADNRQNAVGNVDFNQVARPSQILCKPPKQGVK